MKLSKKLVLISLIRISEGHWWLMQERKSDGEVLLISEFRFLGVHCSFLFTLSFLLVSRAIVVRERPLFGVSWDIYLFTYVTFHTTLGMTNVGLGPSGSSCFVGMLNHIQMANL